MLDSRIALLRRMDDLAIKAQQRWGLPAQMVKTAEECGELTTALCKRLNGSPISLPEIIDEIADVAITVNHMRIAFGEAKVDKRINEKLDRLGGALVTKGSA